MQKFLVCSPKLLNVNQQRKNNLMNFIAIIPARYASTRFPGKPLALIEGKTMIARVYEQVCKAQCFHQVWIATDDERIENEAKRIGANVQMTSFEHRSGTERCAEVACKIQCSENDVVINIQGDEPFINPQQIIELTACFDNPDVDIATLLKKITDEKILHNPNVVKVVKDMHGKALYFSRSPIPFVRNAKPHMLDFYQHIGIYAYKVPVLQKIVKLPATPLELSEQLEQLRWLEHGFKIHTNVTDIESAVGIDTPEDLDLVVSLLKNNKL